MRTLPKLFPVAVALVLAICLSAQAGGGGLKKPGDCTSEEYRQLNSVVGEACKTLPMRCESGMECTELLDRWGRLDRCVKSRRELMDRCFRGGDAAHQLELEKQQRAQTRCLEVILVKCRMDGSCRE